MRNEWTVRDGWGCHGLSDKPAGTAVLLLKHGLLGEHRFLGKQGALCYVRQTGCLQFDPVDVCGKNAELALQSRVKNFHKSMLDDLLYKDRALFDYPDKNLSILPVEDWPYFQRFRDSAVQSGLRFDNLSQLESEAKAYIRENGPVSSDGLPINGSIQWHSNIHWSGNWEGDTNAARAVLEHLYTTGELVIHHKKGTRKFYDLADGYIAPEILQAPDPLPQESDHRKWRVLRRIGAVGLLWNRGSDAWLGIWNLKAPERDRAFGELLMENRILEVSVEGIGETLYCRAEDAPLLNAVLKNNDYKPRCELIAPLDCMLWDRRLIRALFDFEYTWEIYTPPAKRKYGHYVLPLLFGEQFAGRLEAAALSKTNVLEVKNVWFENGIRRTKKLDHAIEMCVRRFAKFNECQEIEDLRQG